MSFIINPFRFGGTGYVIPQSCRFNDDDNAYLSWTPGVAATSTTSGTFSCWFKRGNMSETGALRRHFISGDGSDRLEFDDGGDPPTGDHLWWFGNGGAKYITTAEFRDPTAWYHVVVAIDTTAVAADRMKMYVNGVRITDFSTETQYSASQTITIGKNGTTTYISKQDNANAGHFDGYMAEYVWIDGSQEPATSFGRFDSNGNWVPIDVAAGFQQYTFLTGESSTFGDITGGSGVAGCFDETSGNSYVASGDNWYAGQDWGSGITKTPIRCVYEASNVSDIAGGSHNSDLTLTVYGSNSLPSNGTDGTALGSTTVTDPSNGHSNSERVIIDELTSTTAYRYHWLYALDTGSNNDSMYCGEIEFHEDNGFGFGANGFYLDFSDSSDFGRDAVSRGSSTAYRYFRLNITANGGSGSAQVGELELFTLDGTAYPTSNMTSNSAPSPLVASDNESGSDAFKAFNGVNTDGNTWGLSTATGWLKIDLGSGNEIELDHYTITESASAATNNAPKDWTLEGSNTGSFSGEEEIIDTVTGVTFAASETQTFMKNNFASSGLTADDQVKDSPTDDVDNSVGNYAVQNPLDVKGSSLVFAEGNTRTSRASGAYAGSHSSIPIPSTGKFGFEVTITVLGGGGRHGVVSFNANQWADEGMDVSQAPSSTYTTLISLDASGDLYRRFNNAGSSTTEATDTSNVVGDVFEWLVDRDAATVKVKRNGTLVGTVSSVPADPLFAYGSCYGRTYDWDFGQNGYVPSDAAYSPLCTANLPAPAITDPSAYFQTKLFTGNGTAIGSGGNAVVFGGKKALQPDLVWIKDRDTAVEHVLTDSVRGTTKEISTNDTLLEETVSEGLSSFDTDGFTVGSDASYNASSSPNVAWSWKKGATPGFDIVQYNGDNTANRNISHGLGVVPAFAINKRLDATGEWTFWSQVLTGDDYFVKYATAQSNTNSPWGTGNFSSTQFMVTNNGTNNANASGTNNYVQYLWAEVDGFNKFGTYVGNGSTNGTFIYTGFRPALVITKRYNSTQLMRMFDNKREGYNATTGTDFFITSTTAVEEPSEPFDLLANGFKARTSTASFNASGGTYMFAAWAENPFGGSGVSQARAR